MNTAFSSLNLKSSILSNLSTLGYDKMTPIQAQSLPHILSGKDVIAQGKTGSGKTAAFALNIIEKLDISSYQVQALVLCPTRELADQVAKEIRRLARSIQNIKVLTLCGGVPFGAQNASLESGTHIIVGTPGRIEEHLQKERLILDDLQILVLDEADRMLDMGFQKSIDDIIKRIPKQRQTLLFSATFPESIKKIADRIMQKPVSIKVESTHDNSSIEQHFYKVGSNDERMTALQALLIEHRPESSVVFCKTKKETQEVANTLSQYGFSAIAIHGDLDQRDRDQALIRFSNNSIAILVATDVASRGLDIDNLAAVINYRMPHDSEVYVHRIGRTGRAGSKGISCSLFDSKEHYQVALLEDYFEKAIKIETLPARSLIDALPIKSAMTTIKIDGGKKHKLRPGDILGALTGENGIEGTEVGKINMFDNWAYVAVDKKVANKAIKKLEKGKLKGRTFRVRVI